MRLFREVPITHYPALHAEGWNYLFKGNRRFFSSYFADPNWGDRVTAEFVGWCIDQFGVEDQWRYDEEHIQFVFKNATFATAFKLRWT